MNENYPCDIIQDLLPGYIDEILSETGTRVVKEHLEECEKCNHVYLEMKEGLNSEEELNETLALDGFKKVQYDSSWYIQISGRLETEGGAGQI